MAICLACSTVFMASDYLVLPLRVAVVIPLIHSYLQFDVFKLGEGKVYRVLIHTFYVLTIITMVVVILSLRNEEAIVFSFQFLMYGLFALVHNRDKFGNTYTKLSSGVLYINILLVAIVLAFPRTGGIEIYEEGGYLRLAGVSSAFGLGVYSLVVSYLRDIRLARVQERSADTIHWFSTLINLMSHNLRTPLANIKGNIDILSHRDRKIAGYKEIERIHTSLDVSVGILDRLLKASFVNDQSSMLDLNASIAHSYPSIKVNGKPAQGLTYEQKVSVHLALEVFIDNALKYTEGKVVVTFQENAISIQDEGPGLPNEQLENFASVKAHSVGTLHGIGIPFAARLMDSIGMSINAANTNPGLRITIAFH